MPAKITHAQQVVRDAVATVSKQWGGGWNRVSAEQRQAMVRAEVISAIARIPTTASTDPEMYMKHVAEMAAEAVRWNGEI